MAHPADGTLCPRFHYAVELIGRRWTGAILFLLLRGPTRFTDLREAIPGITDPMLSARLRELEGEGIVERSVLPDTPVRVQYALTTKGHALSRVMSSIGEWSDRWVVATPGAPVPEGGASPVRATARNARTAARLGAPRRNGADAPARKVRASRA